MSTPKLLRSAKKLNASTSVGLGLILLGQSHFVGATTGCGNYASDLFGDHVCVFDANQSKGDIQSIVSGIHDQLKGDDNQNTAEMSSDGYALMFTQGDYGDLSVSVGYYTHVLGLGKSPDDTILKGVEVDDKDWMVFYICSY